MLTGIISHILKILQSAYCALSSVLTVINCNKLRLTGCDVDTKAISEVTELLPQGNRERTLNMLVLILPFTKST